jgi:hypothetical protein
MEMVNWDDFEEYFGKVKEKEWLGLKELYNQVQEQIDLD